MKQDRIARVAALMRTEHLSQLIVTATASVYYLTGLWVEPHERMLALLLQDDGSATLFGNTMFGLSSSFDLPLVLHKDGEDPIAALATALKPGVVGVDKFWYSKFLLPLMARRPDVRPVLGSKHVDAARRRKDEVEREAMRQSSRCNDAVMAAAIAALHDGVREHEIAALVNREYLAWGADGEGVQLVCFGPNGADPHHAADGSVLKPGDSVILDLFTPIGHHWCDMTRTVFYKSVSDQQREIYDLVRRANETAIAAVRPGVPLAHLDQLARAVITEGGYDSYFTHRLGHGCGLDCHEPPDLSSASEAIAEPGMIFSIEPGIYLPGQFGVRIEDLVLVSENGCEVLNHYPKDLLVVG